jgi:hypothetical protein
VVSAPDFARTLATASDAEGIAKLLDRAAAKVGGGVWGDAGKLATLAQRYRDYAAALRECVPDEAPAVAEEQGALL